MRAAADKAGCVRPRTGSHDHYSTLSELSIEDCHKNTGFGSNDGVPPTAVLLPVPYFHVVFTLPGSIADIAYQNKEVIHDLLLKVAAESLITIAADPKHLGTRIGQ